MQSKEKEITPLDRLEIKLEIVLLAVRITPRALDRVKLAEI